MSSPLRIALIRQRYTPYGGAERFVENALNALQENTQIELTLISRKWDGANNPDISNIHCNPFYIGRLWRDYSFAHCACHKIHDNNFDLVQSHERIPCGNIYRAGDGVHRVWLQQRNRILPWWKQLLIKINPYHNYLLRQEIRLFTNPDLSTIIVNSEMVKNELLHYFPNISAKITVIHNAVNTDRFHPKLKEKYRSSIRVKLGIPQHNPIILFVGSGFERKGLPLLLKILPRIDKAHLLIIGKDRKLKYHKQQIQNTTIEKQVHFLGPIKDPLPYYGAADAFAFPTLYDPLPNTVLEAMASGLPVVISDSCGATDLVHDGVEGYIRDALDESGWVEALKQTLQPEVGIQMGNNARKMIQQFSPQQMIKQLSTLYQQLIHQRAH